MTETTTPSAVRPGPAAWGHMIANEARVVARDTAGLIVPIGLPVLVMIMNGFGLPREPLPGTGGLNAMTVFVIPLVLTIVIAVIGMVNMPSFLAMYRKSGVLRRLAVTPAHPLMVLVAQVAVSLAQALIGIAIALAIAVPAFGVGAPANLAGTVGVGLLAIAALYSVGMLVAAVSPTANASVAIGLTAFFVVMALGGGFAPRESLPAVLATVGEVLPFGASVEALRAAWVGGAVDPLHILSLAACTLVCGALAAKFFRWQ